MGMGIGVFQLLIWLCSILYLVCSSLQFDPVDNYLIDCGSPENTSVFNRVFLADNPSILSTPQRIFVNTRANSISSTFGAALYETARVFNGTSRYNFLIKKQGRHWIRLYFFPFSSENFNLSAAKFSVSAQNFILLKDFQPPNSPVVKEYSLNLTTDSLQLILTPSANSFAFLNALEVISLPEELIPSSAAIDNIQGSRQDLRVQALETIARVNMGNETVSAQNDSLWRHWVSDGRFLKSSTLVTFTSDVGIVKYTRGGPSQDIAPASVYGSATWLNASDPTLYVNATWSFDVDPGFDYFIRFHFCDIVSPDAKNMVFNVFMNSLFAESNFHLSDKTSNVLGGPYYMDVITRLENSNKLNVSISPTNIIYASPFAILNGLEIMKMSNNRDSLVAIDSEMQSPASTSSKVKIWVITGSVVGALFITMILAFVFILLCRRSRSLANVGHSLEEEYAMNRGEVQDHKMTEETTMFSMSKMGYRFPLLAVQEATDNFSENLVIGVGGFGKVYKGILRDGTKVAVKRGLSQSQQGFAEFQTEIEMLSQFRHRHLVSLIGYCDEKHEMIIIYEYMENGTLKNHLYGPDFPKLSWIQRLEICIGSARGLHYLHTGSDKAIIHRDVKSANILLDENLRAKVADFGISKTGPDLDQTHVSTAVKGSFGYLDPEYLTRQQLTEKSDVYSFGVVMLEVLCGRPVIDPSLSREMVNLVEWALNLLKRGELEKIADPPILNEIKQESLKKFGETVEKCLKECGADRPTMGDILWNLEHALHLQGNDKQPRRYNVGSEDPPNTSVSSTQFSLGSMGDLAGVSMSKVFSQMVKAENEVDSRRHNIGSF